jgi:hypothetical protein
MRYPISFFASVISFIFISCNQPKHSDEAKTGAGNASAGQECYRAVFQKDTADMKLTPAAGGKVTGTLVMAYGELKPNQVEKTVNTGNILGSFSGDTLFVNYTYTTGTVNKTQYINPSAFLKKGDTLVMGVGDMETSMGRTYFVKDKPIDFEVGRFKFAPVECKE